MHSISDLRFLMGFYGRLHVFMFGTQKLICPTNVNFFIIVMLLNVPTVVPVRLSVP